MPSPNQTTELLDQPLLYPADVAQLLGIPRSTVYELARAGRIPSVRIGRAVRFLRADLETWIKDQRARTGPTNRTVEPGWVSRRPRCQDSVLEEGESADPCHDRGSTPGS